MAALSAPQQKMQGPERTDARTRVLTIAVIVLAIVALGLAGGLGYQLQTTGDTALTAEMEAVIDDYTAAFNAYDGDAFQELVTSDYRLYNLLERGLNGRTAEETATWLSDVLSAYEFSIDPVGTRQMIGDDSGTSVQVTGAERYWSTSQGTTPGISVFVLVKQGDAWLVRSHYVH